MKLDDLRLFAIELFCGGLQGSNGIFIYLRVKRGVNLMIQSSNVGLLGFPGGLEAR